MALITIKPENVGGGRASKTPSAKMYDGGQLAMNAACAALLGNVERVTVQVDDKLPLIILTPTTPTNAPVSASDWRVYPGATASGCGRTEAESGGMMTTEQKPKRRRSYVLNPATAAQRSAERRRRLDGIAHAAGYESWRKLETAALRDEVKIVRKNPTAIIA